MIFWQPMTYKVPQPNSNNKSLESTEYKLLPEITSKELLMSLLKKRVFE